MPSGCAGSSPGCRRRARRGGPACEGDGSPRAAGERFLAAAGQPLTLPEFARILRSRLGDGASRVPKREAPDWLIRAAARFVPKLDPFVATLGEPKPISTAKATNMLGWQPRPAAETVVDTAESLLELRLVDG